MSSPNLLGPPPVLLPVDPAAAELDAIPTVGDQNSDDADAAAVEEVVRRHPTSSLGWALLAEQALERGDDVAAYAYARVGYHRGLDLLRRNGWRGGGPVPWSHEPNRGFLRALAALGHSAAAIDETEEVARVRAFLLDADPSVPAGLLP